MPDTNEIPLRPKPTNAVEMRTPKVANKSTEHRCLASSFILICRAPANSRKPSIPLNSRSLKLAVSVIPQNVSNTVASNTDDKKRRLTNKSEIMVTPIVCGNLSHFKLTRLKRAPNPTSIENDVSILY
jgi:hypothetical protein